MKPDSQPLFDEREISAILKCAAEIQSADGPARTFGLSLAELQQLAAEAGIGPQSVAAAAAELHLLSLLPLDAEEPARDIEPIGRRDQAGSASRIPSEP